MNIDKFLCYAETQSPNKYLNEEGLLKRWAEVKAAIKEQMVEKSLESICQAQKVTKSQQLKWLEWKLASEMHGELGEQFRKSKELIFRKWNYNKEKQCCNWGPVVPNAPPDVPRCREISFHIDLTEMLQMSL